MKLAVKHYEAFLTETHVDTVVVTLDDFSNVFKKKVEFWLKDKSNGIALTQFLAERLSLKFQCKTVTEVNAEGYPYYALLFVDKQKYVINDNGIELDNYVPQIKY